MLANSDKNLQAAKKQFVVEADIFSAVKRPLN